MSYISTENNPHFLGVLSTLPVAITTTFQQYRKLRARQRHRPTKKLLIPMRKLLKRKEEKVEMEKLNTTSEKLRGSERRGKIGEKKRNVLFPQADNRRFDRA